MKKGYAKKDFKPWQCKDYKIEDLFGAEDKILNMRRILTFDIEGMPEDKRPSVSDLLVGIFIHTPEAYRFFSENAHELVKIFPNCLYLKEMLEQKQENERFNKLMLAFLASHRNTEAFTVDLRRLMLIRWHD